MRDEKEISSQIESNADKLFGKDWLTKLAYSAGYMDGAKWADSHPRWISVEDELPKIGWTMSDTVVVTDGIGGLRLAWYHQDEGWHFATGLPFEPTHWMHLSPPPIITSSKKGGDNG